MSLIDDLKREREDVSLRVGGREFHRGMVTGKKDDLKEEVRKGSWRKLFGWEERVG